MMRHGSIINHHGGLQGWPKEVVLQDNGYYRLTARLQKVKLQYELTLFKELEGAASHTRVYLEQEELEALRELLNGAR